MKDKISEAARETFNRRGIRNTTLRDIAEQLAISDGHLRYYFKTKESLILATFQQMEQQIAAFANDASASTAQSILASLTQSFAVMQSYSYFFTESPELLEQYPLVEKAYRALIESRKALFLGIFEQFKKEGVFREEVDSALFPLLFEQFFILSDNWVKYAKLHRQTYPASDPIRHYAGVCVALFLPYFNWQIQNQVLEWIRDS
ncbi:TetR/AcrR family transcriptional regulator [Larkinella ripae]